MKHNKTKETRRKGRHHSLHPPYSLFPGVFTGHGLVRRNILSSPMWDNGLIQKAEDLVLWVETIPKLTRIMNGLLSFFQIL